MRMVKMYIILLNVQNAGMIKIVKMLRLKEGERG